MNEITINTSKLKTSIQYVCWIDTMGTRNTMSESFEKAANFMIRFHAVVIESIKDTSDVKVYPIMDGIYLTCPRWDTLRKVINKIYMYTAQIFVSENVIAHRFIIRGALAWGQVSNGMDITNDVCDNYSGQENYKQTLLFGMPMIQAYTNESFAPPFGMYIHESARQVKGLQGRYYIWTVDSELRNTLREKINTYFDWCLTYSNYLCLSHDKIKKYKQQNEEHLTNMRCNESEFIGRINN